MTHMKKFLVAVAAGVFTQGVLAAGGHDGMKMEGHDMTMQGHDMSGSNAAMGHGGPASAAGEPGNAAQAARTIDLVMGEPGEFIFTPERIQVKAGETVRFRVRNAGKLVHEFVLGDPAELQAHAKMMREQAGMAHKDPNMLTLDPGKTGELVWKFTKPGEFEYACLVPGHYEAGMAGKVSVQ